MKSNTSEPAPGSTRRKRIIITISTIALIPFVAIAVIIAVFFHNYAKETSNPLEQALIKAGAVKLCEGGDAGRGPDNSTPYYSAYMIIPKNHEQTENLINKVAEQNQYRLTHASPSNRGPLGVADIYVHHWYFDNTSKDSAYSDLEPGKVELAFALYNDRESAPVTACEKKESPITVDANNTFIRIKLTLPHFKGK